MEFIKFILVIQMALWKDNYLEARRQYRLKNKDKIRTQRMEYYFRSRKLREKIRNMTDIEKMDYFKEKYSRKAKIEKTNPL